MSESTTETKIGKSKTKIKHHRKRHRYQLMSLLRSYQSSDLDSPLLGIISGENNNNKIIRKSGKIPVSSKKDKERQRWLKDFVWNNNDIKAYTSIGMDPPEHLGQLEKQFLSTVDIERCPIQRSVMVMIRCRAIDYSIDNPKKQERKEYLFYQERWEGKDWRGVPLNPVDSLVGRYTKQFLKPHINQMTGEIDYHELDAVLRSISIIFHLARKQLTI